MFRAQTANWNKSLSSRFHFLFWPKVNTRVPDIFGYHYRATIDQTHVNPMSNDRCMNKEDIVHVYSKILVIKKSKIRSFVEMWMDLESVIQSKSERKKQALYINTYMWNLAWEMSAIVWWLAHSLMVHFLGTGMRIYLFQSCGHCWVFQICSHNECKTLMTSCFGIWIVPLEFHRIH